MRTSPLVLADESCAAALHTVGRTRCLFHGYETSIDGAGIAWATKRVGPHLFAATWLGPGWVFDPVGQERRAEELTQRRDAMAVADLVQHQYELAKVVGHLRLGLHAERILWWIHSQVLAAGMSVARVPDSGLAGAVWGQERLNWPRNWRQDLLAILNGLTWLHIWHESHDSTPLLGEDTALLNHVGDLRDHEGRDACPEDCPERHGQAHHHVSINIGRGFLGVLERFAHADDSGVRTYRFPITSRRNFGPTLRDIGKTGRLVSIFVPAKIGEPETCNALSASQHRLLQAVVRELTRETKKKRRDATEPEIVVGDMVRNLNGKELRPCPYLSASKNYVSFGGNGVRKGLGYRITSEGGWLFKAGYGNLKDFLVDLNELAQALGLIVVGLHRRSHTWFNLDRMLALAGNAVGRAALAQLHLRVYAEADFLQRWSRHFSGEAIQPKRSMPCCRELVLDIVETMARKKIAQRMLALGLEADASFISKLLNGKKRWPEGLLHRAEAWVKAYESEPVVVSARSMQCAGNAVITSRSEEPVLAIALDYLRRRWSVVPQVPGAKKPCVRWKPYQTTLPSEAKMRRWFRWWPNAGLAVLLGPLSDLFVIDVDGPEAHAALINGLGAEPAAPKVLSGSHAPFRYHLFFRHPQIVTKSKVTPWHEKLEFRGNRGIVIIPPSRHSSGNSYVWADGQSPDDLPLPELPAAVVSALTPPARTPVSAQVELADTHALDTSPSTRQFLAGAYAEGPRWNERLFIAACDMRARDFPTDEAEALLLAGARPWNETEAETARRTIKSAYSQPRAPAGY